MHAIIGTKEYGWDILFMLIRIFFFSTFQYVLLSAKPLCHMKSKIWGPSHDFLHYNWLNMYI